VHYSVDREGLAQHAVRVQDTLGGDFVVAGR
jgi:hypothetical protein